VADRSLPPHLSQGASELDVLLPPPEALKPLRTEGFDRNQLKKSRKPTSPNGSNNAVPTAESLAALHQTHKPVKNELIPRRLVVCPIIPPSTKPEPALTIAELVDRPDVGPLLAAKTHDLILVRVGQVLVTPAGMNAADLSISEVSIVRLVDRAAAEAAAAAAAAEALAEAGGPEGVKTKTTRAQAALGKTSNLRNDGIAQDFPVSWVSSTNDVSHKLAQAREYLTTAHRVRLVFQPKRKGGRRDPVPPPDVQAEMLQSAATELADIADRSADDKYDKVKKAAYLCVFCLPFLLFFPCLGRRVAVPRRKQQTTSLIPSRALLAPPPSTSHLEPLPKVRAAYRKLAEAKDAEATSAKAESLRQKEENRLRVAARAEASAKEREVHRRFLESLK